jgi:hypothetical protein
MATSPGQFALLDRPNPHGYTLGERMLRAEGARRALLIAEERQQKARWFYLSFATGYEFLGRHCTTPWLPHRNSARL